MAAGISVQNQTIAEKGEHAIGITATTVSSGAVVACAACCVLPLALPAAMLAGAGAALAWFENASPWMALFSVVVVILSWAMIARQSLKTGRKPARATLILLGISTALALIALFWYPYVEGAIFRLLGYT